MKVTIFAVLVTLGLSVAGTSVRAEVSNPAAPQQGNQYNFMQGGG